MLKPAYNNRMSVIHLENPASTGRALCGWRIRQDKTPNRKDRKVHKKCKKCYELRASFVGGQE